ncbi:hypothetical protein HNR06_001668 [Nocardiopsis arvandica]|uniref:Cytoplasmic protein n=1 Tax=Nocardiopsis sinuspersici TaxID=501010 RepID=A0A7Y9XAQ2_9ACTN|nr:STM4015 family protein [Nocardiopsis sinuspersici]NYH52079.1 hypothetical protein [Nocardiopsis sinuspersici]
MPNTHHVTEFAGLPVVEFPAVGLEDDLLDLKGPATGGERVAAALDDPESMAWRLRVLSCEPEEEFPEYFARFLREVDTSRVGALIVGGWGDFTDEPPGSVPRDLLIEHADAFPALRSLFFGEIVADEYEISWINQPDLVPLLSAFPRLTELTVRGVNGIGSDEGLGLSVSEHTGLRSLTVQSGGLPGRVSREIASSGLPELEHLELWLGTEYYEGDTAPRDLAPLLSGKAFPGLRSLGLRNVENLHSWIPVLAQAPVLPSLEVLDLSLGDLTNEGAQALIEAAPAFRGLRRLDLHHHFLSEDMRERVRAALPGVEVDLSGPREPNTYGGEVHYYTAVAE